MSSLKTSPVIVDCRAFVDYKKGHIAQACSLPSHELFDRMHELPQRQQSIDLYGTLNDIDQASEFLREKNYRINSQTLYTPELIIQLQEQNLWQMGEGTVRLWQASPLVRHFQENFRSIINSAIPTGLDIACGSGRDMTFLASHGWQMCGVDYQAQALSRSSAMAKRENLNTQCLLIDIEKDLDAFQQELRQHYPDGFDLINVSRYLHRPLLPLLAQLLKPGGVLLYQTFMRGCEKISSPKNPHYLLKDDELLECFNRFNILENKVIHLDDGRPVSFFLAQKI